MLVGGGGGGMPVATRTVLSLLCLSTVTAGLRVWRAWRDWRAPQAAAHCWVTRVRRGPWRSQCGRCTATQPCWTGTSLSNTSSGSGTRSDNSPRQPQPILSSVLLPKVLQRQKTTKKALQMNLLEAWTPRDSIWMSSYIYDSSDQFQFSFYMRLSYY